MADTRILVIEDEPMVSEVVERYLRRDGHEVRAEFDGSAGLEAFDACQPDLVVLDPMLPLTDGLVLCGSSRPTRGTRC